MSQLVASTQPDGSIVFSADCLALIGNALKIETRKTQRIPSLGGREDLVVGYTGTTHECQALLYHLVRLGEKIPFDDLMHVSIVPQLIEVAGLTEEKPGFTIVLATRNPAEIYLLSPETPSAMAENMVAPGVMMDVATGLWLENGHPATMSQAVELHRSIHERQSLYVGVGMGYELFYATEKSRWQYERIPEVENLCRSAR